MKNEMKSMSELKKLAKKGMPDEKEYRLAVLGDCATQHISTAIRGVGVDKKMNITVFDSDYNQIVTQITDGESELYRFSPDGVLIFMCTEILYEKFCKTEISERKKFAERIYSGISLLWEALAEKSKANIIQTLYTEYDDRIFGDFGARVAESFIYQLRRLNLLISDGAAERKNVYPCDIGFAISQIGASAHDAKLYAIAKMPYSLEALPLIADRITAIIRSFQGKIKKCIILDLDNTLWGGVIGDDGLENIQIGDLGAGHAYSAFQLWLKEIKNRGIILCVCSKNDEDKAKEPFLKHPDMILSLDDISVFVADWQDKPSNIRIIRDILNIGFDSMVFIDDNPFEREAVKLLLPDVTVPDMPEDAAEYVDYLRLLGLFDTVSFSDEDRNRTSLYKAEADRVSTQSKFDSYDDYLRSLEMKCASGRFEKFWYSRIAQLTMRSNQFNLRTVRYTEKQIEDVATDGESVTLSFRLKDKFGDNGLISVIIMKRKAADTLFVDTWLMSCRVLRRGMEEFTVNRMAEFAKSNGYRFIEGEYLKTPKNSMVEKLYPNMGFKAIGENNCNYILDLENFTPFETFISDCEACEY